uniref:Uncharacterized protein n=1 Tax=Rhabditophanes sp. KR3021 TaxID=114890 RepID=A0AC35U8A8_9BILA
MAQFPHGKSKTPTIKFSLLNNELENESEVNLVSPRQSNFRYEGLLNRKRQHYADEYGPYNLRPLDKLGNNYNNQSPIEELENGFNDLPSIEGLGNDPNNLSPIGELRNDLQGVGLDGNGSRFRHRRIERYVSPPEQYMSNYVPLPRMNCRENVSEPIGPEWRYRHKLPPLEQISKVVAPKIVVSEKHVFSEEETKNFLPSITIPEMSYQGKGDIIPERPKNYFSKVTDRIYYVPPEPKRSSTPPEVSRPRKLWQDVKRLASFKPKRN